MTGGPSAGPPLRLVSVDGRGRATLIVETLETPAYSVSAAARMSGLHPQTLRQYDRLGLVRPHRRNGRRQYSRADLGRLARIAELTGEGVTLVGIAHILRLESELAHWRSAARAVRRSPTPRARAALLRASAS